MFSGIGRTLAAGVFLGLALVSPARAEAGAAVTPKGAPRAQAEKGVATVGYLKLKGEVRERPAATAGLFGKDDSFTLSELVGTLLDAADPASPLAGIVLRLTDARLNRAQAEEIGAAITKLRAAGKKVHVFTEVYGPTELLLGSYADEVIMQAGGAVSLPGLYMEEMFLADALGNIGVTPDFVQIGDYKGAKEMFANSAPSPEWDQNINQLLDSIYDSMTSRLMAGRGLSKDKLEQAMSACFMADGPTAQKSGLIDASLDRLDLDKHLESVYGKGFAWDSELAPDDTAKPDLASMGFFEAFGHLMKMVEGQKHETTGDTIAVLHIDGAIIDGESAERGLMGGAEVGSLTVREALKKIEDDDNVKGVIVRINSPGGSAIASESIWLGLRRVAAKKPVWTSVGSMAASGGYYIAVAGDRIFVDPSSIVGSIGVVGGKMALSGLYQKLKVNVVPRSRGPMAAIMGGLTPWTDGQRNLVRQKMTETYDLFVSRVKAGRKAIDIAKTAEGRLFVGPKAIDLKMADSLGGLDDAVTQMAAKLGLSDSGYDVLDYPAPKSLQEMLQGFMPGGAGSPVSSAAARSGDAALAVQALRELVGPNAWSTLRDTATALLQMRKEPVLLVSPRVLLFK